MAIQSFANKETEDFYYTGKSAYKTGWSRVADIVKRKLDMLHAAARLSDLRIPPSNRLEALKEDLSGYFSIRVNDQWRIVFEWTDHGPSKVRVMDYH